ncbi:DUF305 domain-containing protein [Chroococcidiopsis sp. FACHB-1243]|uniref:DUF305 domain-containing protein n=1 Tax=Chroococcidiopsis sp. [FACHB-1243] TaxID=2692781 RepID=UPI00177C527E|nr:DUF305 domain-containing protein [Chroococcidiopsis sp. [FACHB-1243]]MBD2307273.1 DUF305 domain-containing protein [Chroococcidiopsis sp. [FACHB-1243]]
MSTKSFRQPTSVKTKFLALTLATIASMTSGLLATVSGVSAKDGKTPGITNPHAKQNMQHGSGMMNHGSGMMGSGMAMDLGPADANYDLRFIDAMRMHHQGAIEMAKEAQQKSKRSEIKKLASSIIADQNREIGQMKQWRQAWYPKAGDKPMAYDTKMGRMMQMSSNQMQGMMMMGELGAADSQFDLRFINAMISHHESAVTMAQDALKKSQRPEIKQLAQEIINAQQKEIAQMKQWRKAWYNQ